MSRKPSKPETRIEDYLDVMTGGNAALPQPILRIEFYYAFLAGMTVELPQPILDDEKLLAKICGMEVEAPTYIPGLFPRLYAYMAKKGGQDVQVPDPILRLERYWYDYSAGSPPSVQEYTGAVPVTFVADGTPLIDYIISGNTVQNGTPTPDNPIMPQGTGERTGNLFDGDYTVAVMSVSGNTATLNTASSGRVAIVKCEPNTKYTVKKYGVSNRFIIAESDIKPVNGTAMSIIQNNSSISEYTFTTSSTTQYVAIYCSTSSEQAEPQLMFNSGSTALPYEPYGYKIPISSANTTTPVYLGEVQTTRKIKKLVLTGEENITFASEGDNRMVGFFTIPNMGMKSSETGYCNILQWKNSYSQSEYNRIVANGSTRFYMSIAKSALPEPTIEGFKAYLAAQYAAGTPVSVWYVLANEETAVVNEPLMKIGDYADTLSMEQAGAQTPTASGSTTLDVETTVPPSEVYIKYRGEAVPTLSALPAEVSSPETTTEEANPEETEETENER